MKLSEIRQILSAEQIQLTKSLGQNFLHDANQLGRIADAAELTPTDAVLEIGPGLGPLTQLLVERVPKVLAIEKDQRLLAILQRRLGNRPGLELLHADALDYLKGHPKDWSDWKLVSNLPYSVASPILVELARTRGAPMRMTVTLQREVAQRLAAEAGQEHYGVLSLLVQFRYVPQGWFVIPPNCFFPAPDVDSACITLIRRPEPLLDWTAFRAFEKLVKRGFSQRRKMMLKLLKADWPLGDLERAFEQLGISPQARAETVSLEQYIRLAHLLNRKAAHDQ